MTEPVIPTALAAVIERLRFLRRSFALVGGLAVSVRGEVRFTRDVDLAVVVRDDPDAEQLVLDLRNDGYAPIASVEHDEREHLSTVRLMSPQGVKIDLLFASCGIEAEIVDRATVLDVPHVGQLRCACAEELVAMKILSMTERRLQDRIDASRLLELGDVDLPRVRENLDLITSRGFHRDQDLQAKLDTVLATLGAID
jgi:hypothetical protein